MSDITEGGLPGSYFSPPDAPYFFNINPTPTYLRFEGFTFYPDGRVVIDENVKADEAAQQFLDYIVKWWPKTIKARLDEA